MKTKINEIIARGLAEHYQDDVPTEDLSMTILENVVEYIKKEMPKAIYVNGLRKYNKSVPVINAYNTCRKETFKVLNKMIEPEYWTDGRTKYGKEKNRFISKCGNEHLI